MMEKGATCSSCGTRRDEWPDDPKGPPPFLAVAERCRGCELLEIEMAAQNQGDDRPKGMKFKLLPADSLDQPKSPDLTSLPD